AAVIGHVEAVEGGAALQRHGRGVGDHDDAVGAGAVVGDGGAADGDGAEVELLAVVDGDGGDVDDSGVVDGAVGDHLDRAQAVDVAVMDGGAVERQRLGGVDRDLVGVVVADDVV